MAEPNSCKGREDFTGSVSDERRMNDVHDDRIGGEKRKRKEKTGGRRGWEKRVSEQ